MRSQLTCQIQHNSLEAPFQRTFSLSDVLRVPPKVRLETSPPSPVQLNAPVMVTCHAESFYPDDAKVELFPKDAPSRKGTVAQRISNPDGTFSLKTYLEKTEVTQLPETVSVKAGDSLTLQCTLTGVNLLGGVQWFKGLDRNQPPIYSDNVRASNRGVRLIPRSNTDFSINIPNIRPEDAGIYYCVKFRAGIPERKLASGKGTLVSVIAKPSQPVVRGPTRRVVAGSRASFNCSTEGFSPQEITVSWLKDGKKIQAAQTNILNSDETESISYQVESTVEIPLEQGDVKSQLTCQIQHRSLDGPLQQAFPLSDVLRAPGFLAPVSLHGLEKLHF
ncbi:signal-regulatory protein beta-1-like [Protobothrops mucrosquamatus]|uniref:signal-regulatory protein beta-1-like n=1 Tax=Protobothrops mucrosquamatus TaxID=103944 RepID=UPI0010FB5A6C|nr:signal-regulatory protein beta-1-like [Protobothrops mucrosquamatus]